MNYRVIDMEQYSRKAHFEYFKSLPYPYVGLTVDVDVTGAVRFCKENHQSFYLTMLHLVALAADEIPEFRQRIHGDQIVEYDECPTSHVELLPDQSYCYCTLRHHMELEEYYREAEKARQKCTENGIEEDVEVDSFYFISSVPWVHYSALIQPVAGGEESNPRITWGKYTETEEGRLMMPVSVLAHHALVDGIQIGQFYKNVDKEIHKIISKRY